MKEFKCPKCAAPFNARALGATLQCPYCAGTFVVPPELREDTEDTEEEEEEEEEEGEGEEEEESADEDADEEDSDDEIFFEDDFSDDSTGWEPVEGFDGSQAYADGGYRLRLEPGEAKTYASDPEIEVGDASFEVEITKVRGPDDSWFGLVLRAGDEGCYHFDFYADGRYGIYGYSEEAGESYTLEEHEPDGSVHTGNACNALRAVCRGTRLELHLNGRLVLRVNDDSLDHGRVELAMGRATEDGGRLEAVFKNLRIETF